MDKASDFGSEDWGFKSLRGRFFSPPTYFAYIVILEGKFTTEMQLKHTDSSLKVILEVKKQIDDVSDDLSTEERERLNQYKKAPLLTGKVNL